MVGARAVAPWETPQTHPSTAGPASSVHLLEAQSNPWGWPGRWAIQEPPTHHPDTLVLKSGVHLGTAVQGSEAEDGILRRASNTSAATYL